jgi:hypothetical protein
MAEGHSARVIYGAGQRRDGDLTAALRKISTPVLAVAGAIGVMVMPAALRTCAVNGLRTTEVSRPTTATGADAAGVAVAVLAVVLPLELLLQAVAPSTTTMAGATEMRRKVRCIQASLLKSGAGARERQDHGSGAAQRLLVRHPLDRVGFAVFAWLAGVVALATCSDIPARADGRRLGCAARALQIGDLLESPAADSNRWALP